MQRIQRTLIVLICLCAIALSACLGPSSRSSDTRSTASDESVAVTDTPANADAEDTNEPADLEISKDEQAKISDIAYLSGRANAAPVQERIVLLALKYERDRITIENVLYDYLKQHSGFKEGSNFTRTIYQIRDRYGLSAQEIAQILLDYKAWLSQNKSPI